MTIATSRRLYLITFISILFGCGGPREEDLGDQTEVPASLEPEPAREKPETEPEADRRFDDEAPLCPTVSARPDPLESACLSGNPAACALADMAGGGGCECSLVTPGPYSSAVALPAGGGGAPSPTGSGIAMSCVIPGSGGPSLPNGEPGRPPLPCHPMQPLSPLPPVPMGGPIPFEYEMTICAGIKSDPTMPQRSYPLGNGAVWVQYADRVVFCRSTPVSTGGAVEPAGFPGNDPSCQGAVPIACDTVGIPNFDKNGDGKITDEEMQNGIDESCGTMDPSTCTTAQQFGDHDKDRIPNIHDLTPEGDKGPNGEPPRLNPAGWVPANLAILEHLFADLGLPVQGLGSALSGRGITSLPDKDGDGTTTLADLITTVRDALVQSAGEIGGRADDYRAAASGSLSLQEWSQLAPDLVARVEAFMVFSHALDSIVFGLTGEARILTSGEEQLRRFSAAFTSLVRVYDEYISSLEAALTAEIMRATGVSPSVAQQQAAQTMQQALGGNPAINRAGTEGELTASGGVVLPTWLRLAIELSPLAFAALMSSTGDPVDPATGAFLYERADLALDGVPGVVLERQYRSNSMADGWFGRGWSSFLDEKITLYPSLVGAVLERRHADGSVTTLTRVSQGDGLSSYRGTRGDFTEARVVTSNEAWPTWTRPNMVAIREPGGTTRYYCPPVPTPWGTLEGGLVAIVAPTGERLTIDRPLGVPTRIIDSLGRVIEVGFDYRMGTITELRRPPEDVDAEGEVLVRYEYDAPNPPRDERFQTHDDDAKKEPNSYGAALRRVTYPKTLALVGSGEGKLESVRPTESYSYAARRPELTGADAYRDQMSLRLVRVDDALGRPKVEVEYDPPEADDEHRMRTRAVVAGGDPRLRWTYDYERIDLAAEKDNLYFTTEITPEGVGRTFRYDDSGQLSELISIPADPAAPQLTRSYVYDDQVDSRILEINERASDDPGPGFTHRYTYDVNNVSRLAQKNVSSSERCSSAAAPRCLVTRFTYDPVTNTPNSMTDTLGRTTRVVYGHQLFSSTQVAGLHAVNGWSVDVSGLVFVTDHFLSSRMSIATGPGRLTYAAVNPVMVIHPDARLASSDATPRPGKVERFAFDDRGYRIAEQNASGVITEAFYSPDKLLELVVHDAGGRALRTRYAHDDRRRRTDVWSPLGVHTKYTRDEYGREVEVRVEAPSGSGIAPIASQRFYDPNGNEVGSVLPQFVGPYQEGYRPKLASRSHFDSLGQEVEVHRFVRDALGGVTATETSRLSYSSDGDLVRSETAGGALRSVRRGMFGEVLEQSVRDRVSGRELSKLRQRFDGYGRPVEIFAGDRPNAVLTIEYDAFGRAFREWDAEGKLSESKYDDVDRVLEVSLYDRGGRRLARRRFEYNETDSILEERRSIDLLRLDGSIAPLARGEEGRSLAYDQAGQLVSAKSAPGVDGSEVEYEYAKNGELVRIKRSDRIEHHERDAFGRLVELTTIFDDAGRRGTNPSSVTHQTGYDALSRPVRNVNGVGDPTITVFDEWGRMKEQILPGGLTQRFEYDGSDRIVAVTEAKGGVSRRRTFEYGPEDQLKLATQYEGQKTSHEYDALGRLTRRILEDGTGTEASYDLEGRLVRMARIGDPIGTAQTFVYDDLGRMTALAAVGADAPVHRRYEHYPIGGLSSVTETVGTRPPTHIEWERTTNGEPLLERASAFGTTTELRATLDAMGRVDEITLPSGRRTRRSYDAWSRLRRVDDLTNQRVLWEALEFYGSSPSRLAFGSGHQLFRGVDARGYPTELRLENGGGGVEESWQIARNALGSPLRIDRRRGSSSFAEQFEVDEFERLTRATFRVGGSDVTQTFRRDENDNILEYTDSRQSSPTRAGYGPIDEQLNFGSTTFSYNERGERTTGAGAAPNLYDALGRPMRMNGVEVHYDAEDRRIGEMSGSNWVAFAYAGASPALRFDGSGMTEYLPVTGAVVALQGGTARYLVQNPFGDVAAVATTSGVGARYSYAPYGAAYGQNGAAQSSASFGGDLGFMSKPLSIDGTIAAGPRVYDPQTGVFGQVDPGGPAGNLNAYAFSANPLTRRDPSGYRTENLLPGEELGAFSGPYSNRPNLAALTEDRLDLLAMHAGFPQDYRSSVNAYLGALREILAENQELIDTGYDGYGQRISEKGLAGLIEGSRWAEGQIARFSGLAHIFGDMHLDEVYAMRDAVHSLDLVGIARGIGLGFAAAGQSQFLQDAALAVIPGGDLVQAAVNGDVNGLAVGAAGLGLTVLTGGLYKLFHGMKVARDRAQRIGNLLQETERRLHNQCVGSCAPAAVRNAARGEKIGERTRIWLVEGLDQKGQRSGHAIAEFMGTDGKSPIFGSWGRSYSRLSDAIRDAYGNREISREVFGVLDFVEHHKKTWGAMMNQSRANFEFKMEQIQAWWRARGGAMSP